MKTLLILSLMMAFTTPIFGGEIRGKITIQERSPAETDWKVASSFADAVVFITGFEEAPVPRGKIFHDQKDKQFFPRVLPITRGESVNFRNLDPINHNVFSLSKAKKFDLGLFKAPVEKSMSFEKAGLVKLFCNIHHQMIATLLVLKNNKYFHTGPDGTYVISGIPAGKHKLKVWVEGTRPKSKAIVVTDDSSETHDFTIQVVRRPLQHLNKLGKPYKKY